MTSTRPSLTMLAADVAREQRMVLALLISTDPLGFAEPGIAAADAAAAYERMAATVVAALRAGGDAHALRDLCADATDDQAVDAFVRATISWWIVDAPARRDALAA